MPAKWDELPSFDRANTFDVFAAAARAQQPDPWAGYWDVEQTLTERMRKAVGR